MSKSLLLAALAATLVPVTAPAIARRPPVTTNITVQMSHRAFRPQVIRLKGGQSYRLTFVNSDRTEHEFFAPDFLAASRIAPGARIDRGRLNVRSGETRSITLIPTPGHYEAKSTKALDVISNMKAQILVY